MTYLARNTDGMDAFIIIETPYKKNIKKKFMEIIQSVEKEKYSSPNWKIAPLDKKQAVSLLEKFKLNELYDTKEEDDNSK